MWSRLWCSKDGEPIKHSPSSFELPSRTIKQQSNLPLILVVFIYQENSHNYTLKFMLELAGLLERRSTRKNDVFTSSVSQPWPICMEYLVTTNHNPAALRKGSAAFLKPNLKVRRLRVRKLIIHGSGKDRRKIQVVYKCHAIKI